LANDHVTADGTGNCATNEDQVVFRIEPSDCHITDGDILRTIVTGHTVALEDVVRIGVHTDRPNMPVHLLHAVAGTLTGEIMPHHSACRASPLGDTRDIDGLDICKDVDLKLLADLKTVDGRAKFANEPLGFGIGLGDRLNAGSSPLLLAFAFQSSDVTALAATGQATRLIQESDLDRFITIAVGRLQLEDVARTRLDHGNRDYAPQGVKNLRHPDLAAE